MIDISIAKTLCMRFEGFRSHPYLDPVGLPTIGFGTRFYGNGDPVKMTDPPISIEIGAALLEKSLQGQFAPGLMNISPGLSALPKTMNAILDFCYNLGLEKYRKSTLRQLIDAADWEKAKVEILKWDHAGANVLPGLNARRHAESDLIGTD